MNYIDATNLYNDQITQAFDQGHRVLVNEDQIKIFRGWYPGVLKEQGKPFKGKLLIQKHST